MCARRGERDMNVRNEGMRRLPETAAHSIHEHFRLVPEACGPQVIQENFIGACEPNVRKWPIVLVGNDMGQKRSQSALQFPRLRSCCVAILCEPDAVIGITVFADDVLGMPPTVEVSVVCPFGTCQRQSGRVGGQRLTVDGHLPGTPQ